MPMRSVDSSKRYDIFVSFHGQQPLSTLDLPTSPGIESVRHLVQRVLLPRLQRPHRWPPTVFYDSIDLSNRVSDIFDAILQLRGGGLALVLLTARYFTRRYCLAELRAFLHLAGLSRHPSRQHEAITIRFICLEPDRDDETGVHKILRIVKDMKNNEFTLPFVQGLDDYVIQSLTPSTDAPSTPTSVANQIADHVWKYWDHDESRPNIGSTQRIAFLDMQRFFDHTERRDIGRVLGVDVHFNYEVQDVIDTAIRARAISYNNLDLLLLASQVCQNPADAIAAITSFKHRWCSHHWSWSAQTKDALLSYVQEAQIAIQSSHDEEDIRTGIDVSASPKLSPTCSKDEEDLEDSDQVHGQSSDAAVP